MKERPILFSAPMVRAILDGRKTQTRRIIKLPHQNPLGEWERTTWGGAGARDKHGNEHPEQAALWHTRTGDCLTHGALPGDRLWVRETFTVDTASVDDCRAKVEDAMPDFSYGPFYRADMDPLTCQSFPRWYPSIHMPRWASRITLEITAVRVERLQDISEADARAEGVEGWARGALSPEGQSDIGADGKFELLWSSINGRESWDRNPLVWVIEFKRVTA